MQKVDGGVIAAIEEILRAGATAEVKVVRGRVNVVEIRRKLRHPPPEVEEKGYGER